MAFTYRVYSSCSRAPIFPSSFLQFTNPISRIPPSRVLPSMRSSYHFASLSSTSNTTATQNEAEPQQQKASTFTDDNYRWRPMCLYHAQGKCTMMDDLVHLERFNHDCSKEFHVNVAECKNFRPQSFEYFLVLDLEGKVEILEFPVLIIDAKTMNVVDLFHRFVRPSRMSEQRINEYIEGKYGKFGVDRVWHDTAIPFNEVLEQFEDWLSQHNLWRKDKDGRLNGAAFITCGNWDLKTKVPQQCEVSRMKLPLYFMEWINLKDIYLNFYRKEARGMMTMMKQLGIPLRGSHHLGLDDTKNIARVLQRMLADGAVMNLTARRNPNSPKNVEFLCKYRIR